MEKRRGTMVPLHNQRERAGRGDFRVSGRGKRVPIPSVNGCCCCSLGFARETVLLGWEELDPSVQSSVATFQFGRKIDCTASILILTPGQPSRG
jgi:hypothetical protein